MPSLRGSMGRWSTTDLGINFLVGGAIEVYGKLVWSIEEVETALRELE